MNLQDLKDDLEYWFKFASIDGIDAEDHSALGVARRVADLWDECPVCAPPEPVSFKPSQCLRCHGLRVVPSGKWGDWRGNGPTINPAALYRYLFGEDA